MAGRAVLYILARRLPMFGTPGQRRMCQRHPVLTLVAIVAECPPVVATRAVRFRALRIKSVRELIVQVVNITGQIVAPVAVQAELLVLMTG